MGDKSNDIKADRIPWIDISKGILILCLVYGHHKLFAMRSGYEDGVTVFIHHSMRFMQLSSCRRFSSLQDSVHRSLLNSRSSFGRISRHF